MNILVLTFETLIIWHYFKFEFKRELNYHEINNRNRGDVASLAEVHCSLITRVSQFSSTTRNLVPRFKRWSRGESSCCEILTSLLGLGCPHRRGWFLSLMSPLLCFNSSWSSHHLFFRIFIVLRTRQGGKTLEERIPTTLGIWRWTQGENTRSTPRVVFQWIQWEQYTMVPKFQMGRQSFDA
jgi:hypothetical protein